MSRQGAGRASDRDGPWRVDSVPENDNSVTAVTDAAEATGENKSPTHGGRSCCAIWSATASPRLTAQEALADKAGECLREHRLDLADLIKAL